MIRLVGILVGAALAVAVLILLVGIPGPAARQDVPVEQPAGKPAQPAAELQPLHAASEPIDESLRAVEPPASVEAVPQAAVMAAAEPEPGPRTEPGTQRWHAFWTPFRSRIAATGFMERLQRVTGLDYRVVNVRPGVYEVAFAYREDADIATNLAEISAATGLDIPGS